MERESRTSSSSCISAGGCVGLGTAGGGEKLGGMVVVVVVVGIMMEVVVEVSNMLEMSGEGMELM